MAARTWMTTRQPWERKIMTRTTHLILFRPPIPIWRPRKNLLSPPPIQVSRRKGIPLLDKHYDPLKKKKVGGFRKYRPPPKPRPPIRRDYNPGDCHEMLGKFRFEAQGTFPESGQLFMDDFRRRARELYLRGWIKGRSAFAIGCVQGDVYALSHLRRWLEDRYSPHANIASLKILDESFGIPELEYKVPYVFADRDLRKPKNVERHLEERRSRVRLRKMVEESHERQNEIEKFVESHCVRTW
ncbi:unnamed protein product [Vitrella brassicaformis CCMP3155]|uniref:Acylphosphatase-like domain-containing protein n=1 Tax=Vitrella brassicaformis (strain CCMP3155) TaxID=1169540 RepID=A0A0G4FI85_VITBC|nr:unnamed protein product [Vitrella brassicaformis CCMP3155]|mmetsp:Transcript_23166/g.57308  ORF Transcript_23166/g.57308 Transcript_23166/m.57308 type:complete len:242 (-) Transcript_23166:386-1111(-)|eukprot:CEM13178.1 unnamed protein product [Vitrella brassicaformis CCMP3155]